MKLNNYFEALLFMLRVIVYADGVFDDDELAAIKTICKQEGISDEYYNNFNERTKNMSEKSMYLHGIDLVQACPYEEQLSIFIWLYKMAEVDGNVHVKEVRFLLYSIRHVDIDFNLVKEEADKRPSIKI